MVMASNGDSGPPPELRTALWDDTRRAYVCGRCGMVAYDAEGDFVPHCKCYDFIQNGRRYWNGETPR